jgi:hypothetical protein
MIPYNPFRLASGKQLDPEGVNDNLEKMTADLNRSMALRYSYSEHIFELDGVVNTDTAAERTYRLKRHVTNGRYEVVGVELVIFSSASPVVTWTLSCNDADWPSIAVETAGTTTEARATSPSRAQVPSGDGLEFVLTTSNTSTITRGYIVFRMRADRGSQHDDFTPYTPTLLNAASSTAGSTLDTELNAYEDSVVFNTAADKDYRFETFRVKDLLDTTARTWRIPGGAYRWGGVHLATVSAIGDDLELRVGGSLVATASGAGLSTIGSTVGDFTGAITPGTDPMDPADDTIVSLTANGGTISVGYVTIIWS